jgi:hypothetical protein
MLRCVVGWLLCIRHRPAGIRPRAGPRALHILEAGYVTFMDTHAILDGRQVPERWPLVREAVDLVATRNEMLGEMTACETGDAGDEHAQHDGIVPLMVRRCPARS